MLNPISIYAFVVHRSFEVQAIARAIYTESCYSFNCLRTEHVTPVLVKFMSVLTPNYGTHMEQCQYELNTRKLVHVISVAGCIRDYVHRHEALCMICTGLTFNLGEY